MSVKARAAAQGMLIMTFAGGGNCHINKTPSLRDSRQLGMGKRKSGKEGMGRHNDNDFS
jgi:hypothetical protein